MSSQITLDDPRHGTDEQPASASAVGCNCRCCDSARRLKRRRAKQRDQGKRRVLDPARVLVHIEHLRQHGWNYELMGRISGVSQATVSDLVRGRSKRVHVDTATALLTLGGPPPYDTAPGVLEVPAHGTVRRLQALAALGWPIKDMCAAAGLTPKYGSELLYRMPHAVDSTTSAAVRAVYDRLNLTRPPDSPITRGGLTRARNRGWLPPAAWDDIDDPTEKPPATITRLNTAKSKHEVDHAVVERVLAGDRLKTTTAEKVEIMRRWLASGGYETTLCKRMGWNTGRYLPGDMEATA